MTVENTHPLKGLYLLRYCKEGLDPAASVMDVLKGVVPGQETDADIEQVANLLEGSVLSRKMSQDPAERRAYAVNYINIRREMDGYLEGNARLKGVEPENTHPLYFILHHDPKPEPPLMTGNVIAIPGENIPASLVSFTVDDSFYNFPSKPTSFRDPAHGTVFNAGEMAEILKERGWLPNFPDTDIARIYEAQLWSRRIDNFSISIDPVRDVPAANPGLSLISLKDAPVSQQVGAFIEALRLGDLARADHAQLMLDRAVPGLSDVLQDRFANDPSGLLAQAVTSEGVERIIKGQFDTPVQNGRGRPVAYNPGLPPSLQRRSPAP